MALAAIAIGSNLGDRLAMVRAGAQAVASLEQTRLVRVSGVIETAAVMPPPDASASPTEPAATGPDYLNAVVLVETELRPRELLDRLLEIERSHGRVRAAGERWGARTLDLDLLFVGDAVIAEPGLVLPHPRMHERAFVLRPLAEVAPEWVQPMLGRTVVEMLKQLRVA